MSKNLSSKKAFSVRPDTAVAMARRKVEVPKVEWRGTRAALGEVAGQEEPGTPEGRGGRLAAQEEEETEDSDYKLGTG